MERSASLSFRVVGSTAGSAALAPLAGVLARALPVDHARHLGGAPEFFFLDAPKVLLLLVGIVFAMGMVNSYFTPKRTRALLAERRTGAANVMAATLGIVTPFRSCSAVPLCIRFVRVGVAPSRAKVEAWLAPAAR
jgi:uncharacterized protein